MLLGAFVLCGIKIDTGKRDAKSAFHITHRIVIPELRDEISGI